MASRRTQRIAAALLLLAAVAGMLALPPSRDNLLALLGDDLRGSAVAFYSALVEPDADTEDLAPMAHTDHKPYAINVFLEQEVEEWKIRRTLEMARDAGFAWIKQQMPWSDVEMPAKGQYVDSKNNVPNTWLKYDRIVGLAQEYGLQVVFRLDSSPDWARIDNPKEQTPPDDVADFGDFVGAVVSRYKGQVRYYQIWNEPNLSFEWGGKAPNAADYVRLLEVAFQRAKQADPDSVIIAAALAPTVETSSRATNDLAYLQQMYDAGGGHWFDILAANPYGLRSGPDDRRLEADTDVNFSRPILMREIMVRNGDAAKPIWGAELGWNALPEGFPGEAPWGRVTREQQAAYTVRGYQRMQEEWPWMGVAALWHFRMVHDVNRVQPQYYFGIVQNDFHPYPVYDAMKKLANAPPVLYPGFHQESHWTLNFDGAWQPVEDARASLGRLIVSATSGDKLSFVFQGSDLDLLVRKDANSGRLRITVDGGAFAANRLPRDASGAAYVDLFADGERWQQAVAVSRGLPWGLHRAEVTSDPDGNGRSAVAIDAVVVKGRPPNEARQIALGFLGVCILAAGTALARRKRSAA